jgi:hypothetical protein
MISFITQNIISNIQNNKQILMQYMYRSIMKLAIYQYLTINTYTDLPNI